jgi:phosphoribosylamine--glycine ligase
MKDLILGGGGREHALGWKISEDEGLSQMLYAPGNAGTAVGIGRNVAIDPTNKEAVLELVKKEQPDQIYIGPEGPLANGMVDHLNRHGFDCVFGPTQESTRLESDKFFSFELMDALGIDQAESVKCVTLEEAVSAIKDLATEQGVVAKAPGLHGGKGVSVYGSKEEALAGIETHVKAYGPEVLIAERLFGQEVSIFGICDGSHVLPIELSLQDHKRQLDGDKGPNTGGMGAYGPVPIAPPEVVRQVAERIMAPVVQKMEYRGFLYAGMMMTKQGPKVLEFNARLGDPECQPAMMMLDGNLRQVITRALDGDVRGSYLKIKPGAACCVVLASKGYPGDFKKGLEISGINDAACCGPDVNIFHAGTKHENGKIVTSGGRVLGITAYSPQGIADAQQLAYQVASKISIPGGFQLRTDIAQRAITELI